MEPNITSPEYYQSKKYLLKRQELIGNIVNKIWHLSHPATKLLIGRQQLQILDPNIPMFREKQRCVLGLKVIPVDTDSYLKVLSC